MEADPLGPEADAMGTGAGGATMLLGRQRAVVTLTTVTTVMAAAVFAWKATMTLDRPWFAMLAVISVAVGALLRRAALRRPTSAAVRADGTVVVERLAASPAIIPLAGLSEVTILKRNVVHSVRAAQPREWTEVVVAWPDRAMIFHARRAVEADGFARAIARSAATTDVKHLTPPDVVSAITAHSGFMPAARRVNPPSVSTPSGITLTVVTTFVVASILILAVGTAFIFPSIDGRVTTSAEARRALADRLTGLPTASGTEVATVSFSERKCERDEQWLWGTRTDHSRLEFTARAPIDDHDATRIALDRIIDTMGGRWSSEGSSGTLSATSPPFVIADDHLTLTYSTACIDDDDVAAFTAAATVQLGDVVAGLAAAR